jgi:glycosyltransferase involved in cell wall biosynthesis
MHRNIGFISTRFAGTDGVSLEANKWADVFEELGHSCFWFAGELDHNPEKCVPVPEAHFQNSQNKWINSQIYGRTRRGTAVTDLIHTLRCHLKYELQNFIDLFKIDLLVIENALSLPMSLPLGIALAELISETQIPTIAHHHDFYWERIRYNVNAVGEYLQMAFPPDLPNIEHVVINSGARDELVRRRSVTATCIPNVFDFDNPTVCNHIDPMAFRKSFGLKNNDLTILQPTRIIQRKGIEHAVELVKRLGDPRCKLLISHEGGDEGYEYVERIKDYASENDVDLRIAKNRTSTPLNHQTSKFTNCCLWSIYSHADFITFPSLYEGFGNAFLEAIYFKKPLLVNRYPAFVSDIEPKGFDLVVIDGFLTKDAVQNVKDILHSRNRREKMVGHNYQIARRFYSYSVLRERLGALLLTFFRDTELPVCSGGNTGSRYVDRIEEDLPITGVAG